MFSRLSPTSIYRRFFSPLPRVPEWAVAQAIEVDHLDKESLVAVAGGEIVGQATYARPANSDEAEAAIVVEDGWQRRGIGKRLLSELAERARRRGIGTFTGAVLPENGAMRGLLAACGGGLRYSVGDGAYVAHVPLLPPGPDRRLRRRRAAMPQRPGGAGGVTEGTAEENGVTARDERGRRPARRRHESGVGQGTSD
jgi:GNAT superfamily N-acetyltransferase